MATSSTSSTSVGTLSTSTGVARLIGTSSKIDTDSLVTAAYEAKRAPAVRLESSIKSNEAKSAAYGDLKSLLTSLKNAVAGLRNPPGALSATDNLFEAKEAYLTSSSTTAATSLVGVDVTPGTAKGSFTMSVGRLATVEKQASLGVSATGAKLADAWNAGTAFSGELVLGLDGGTSTTVAVNGDMTITDLRDAINAGSAQNGVTASVLKVSDTDYRLVLTGTQTGKAINVANGTGDDVLARAGLSKIQAAQTARLTVDGVAVERAANTIDDLYPGLTISLYKAEPATTVTVSVEPALSTIKDGIKSFVTAYNDLRSFVTKQSALSDSGTADESAVLFGDRTMRAIADSVAGMVGRSVAGGASGKATTLRDLGISLDESNQLELDETKLDRQLLNDPEGVRGVLEFGFTSSSSDVRVLSRTNELADHSFTLSIVDADQDGIPESASFDGVAADVTGGRITGRAGTPYAGLKLAWAGHGSTSIQIGTRPGIADSMYNALDAALDTSGGSLQRAMDDLDQLNTGYKSQIEQIDSRAEALRTRLVDRYASMEAAMSLADVMLQQVRAQMDAMSSSN